MIDVFGSQEQKRSRVAADLRLSLPSQFLPHLGEVTKAVLKPFKGRTVVEMMPLVRQQGRILVPNADGVVDDLRPDVGRILGASSRAGCYGNGKEISPQDGIQVLEPGMMVAVSTDHGKWITNAVFGDYHAPEQVRAYGVVADGSSFAYNVPRNIPWFSSILGIMNTTTLPVVRLKHGDTAPKQQVFHRGFRTAFCVEATITELAQITLPCPDDKGFNHHLELDSGTYVVTWFTGYPPQVSVVGDTDVTSVEIINEDVPLRPTHKKVLIERYAQVEKTRGGIMLTAKEQFRPTLGKVIDCGPECTEVEPGMTVLYLSRVTRNISAPWLPDRSLVIIEEDGILSEVPE